MIKQPKTKKFHFFHKFPSRAFIWISLFACILLAIGFFVKHTYFSKNPHFFNPEIAEHVFDAQKADQTHPLHEIKGPKMILLWTVGCGPCLRMLWWANQQIAIFQERGIRVIPLLVSNMPKEHPKALWAHAVVWFSRLSQKQTATWQIVLPKLTPYYDKQGEIVKWLDMEAAPVLLFLNAQNEIIVRLEGFQDWGNEKGRKVLDDILDKIALPAETSS